MHINTKLLATYLESVPYTERLAELEALLDVVSRTMPQGIDGVSKALLAIQGKSSKPNLILNATEVGILLRGDASSVGVGDAGGTEGVVGLTAPAQEYLAQVHKEWTAAMRPKAEPTTHEGRSVAERLHELEQRPISTQDFRGVVARLLKLEDKAREPFDFTDLVMRLAKLEAWGPPDIATAKLLELSARANALEAASAAHNNELRALHNRVEPLERQHVSPENLLTRLERLEEDPARKDHRALLQGILEDVAKAQRDVDDIGRLVYPARQVTTKPLRPGTAIPDETRRAHGKVQVVEQYTAKAKRSPKKCAK